MAPQLYPTLQAIVEGADRQAAIALAKLAPSGLSTRRAKAAGKPGQNGAPGLTVFAYGQTGAGKTYTMEPIYQATIRETLHAAPAAGLAVSIRFFEIYCAKVFDLLNSRAGPRAKCALQATALPLFAGRPRVPG